MPYTTDEFVALAQRLADDELMPDDAAEWPWADGTTCTCEEWHDLMATVGYIARLRRAKPRRKHQRRAMKLLRSLLSPEQRRQLRASGYFLVTGSRGGVYRLRPRSGHTMFVKRHGSRWYPRWSFCLHDDRSNPEQALPDADLTIAHLLLLRADEEGFLALANATRHKSSLWDGDYLRRVAEGRREREAQKALETTPVTAPRSGGAIAAAVE